MRKAVLFLSFGAMALMAPSLAFPETASPAPAVEITLPAISVTTAKTEKLQAQVLASGMVEAVELVQVQPLIEGQPIETLDADVGDKVRAGQVLATLSLSTLELQKSQFAASLAAARASIAQAEAQVLEVKASAAEAQRVNERTQALTKNGTSSQAAADTAQSNAVGANARVAVATQTLEAARAQVALVDAQIANVELQLSRTKVVAPVDGEIVSRNAQLGAIASASGPTMFVIIRDNALELRADVAEGDLLSLAPGQPVTLSAVGAAAPLAGKVRLVEPSVDPATRMGRVRISVNDPEALRTGMFVDATILVAEHDSVAIPLTAIGSSPDGATVMRVTDGTVEQVVVTTGIRDNGMIEIVTGLSDGDTVVLKAGAFVRNGDKINPVSADSGTN